MRYLQQTNEMRKVKLDAKDEKILTILCANSRISGTRIAKRVGLSRDAVKYRIRNYEKRGIIQGYRTLVDMSKFGYCAYHLFIKLNNPSQDVEEKIIKKLIKYDFVRAILKFSGNFDFEIALVAKSVEELDRRITEIISTCSNFLQDYELLTLTKTYAARNLPKSFSGYNYEENGMIKKRVEKKFNIDKKDIEILKIIGNNALTPLFDVGEKVKLSADAVAYRIRKMKEEGFIIKFFPVINYSALSYSLHTVLLSINVLDGKMEKILEEFLSCNKNTLWAVKAIGRFNVIIYFLVRDADALQKTMIELRALFPGRINHFESMLAYEEYKFVYFPAGLF